MKVAVFGATGSVGSLVVAKLVELGHTPVAVSRSGADYSNSKASVAQRIGDMTDPGFVAATLAECDAVISCLGMRRQSKSFWSKRTSPADLLSSSARAVVTAIAPDPAKRLIYLGAFGVGEDLPKHSIIFRTILRTSSLKDAYLDHARAEAIIKSSSVNWTIVRAPGLTFADTEVKLVDCSDRWSSFTTVSRKSIARFLVDCLADQTTSRKCMTVGEAKP